MTRQLALDIGLRDRLRFDSFVIGPNRFLFEQLLQRVRAPDGRPVLFCGDAATGKSHLLHAACAEAHAAGRAVSYVGLRDQVLMQAEGRNTGGLIDCLDGLERFALVCVDDVDAVAGRPAWERALFGLYNACESTAGCLLLMSARSVARRVGFGLPDLASRLEHAWIGTLAPHSDEQRAAVLRTRARERGLQLGEEVIDYMLRHLPRDLPGLLAVVDALDTHSLERKRRISLALLREWLDARAGSGPT